MDRLRLGWLPDTPESEQHDVMCDGDEITSYAYGNRRLQLRQVEDPDRQWARGAGRGWRQQTIEGRRLDWRVEDDQVVVFQRIGNTVAWIRADGFSTDDALRAAASLANG